MIALSPAARVYLACGVTDMRNYAECMVMRSASLGANIAAVYPATPLRIITTLLDAHRIKENAHVEFHDYSHGPDLVS